MKAQAVLAIISLFLMFLNPVLIEAATLHTNVEDLPPDGWEITAYLNGDPNSSNPAEWPTLFRLAVNGWAVKVECTQHYTPVPPLETKCSRSGNIFNCQSGPGEQNRFEFVEIIEEPPPQPTPSPVPAEFTAIAACYPQNQHSNDVRLTGQVKDQNGNPLPGATVNLALPDGNQSTTSGGNGIWEYPFQGARAFIGSAITINVDALTPQQIPITAETFAPCTAYCDSFMAAYDPGAEVINLTGKGGPAGMGFAIWDEILDPNTPFFSGTIDETETVSGIDNEPVGGINSYRLQVGGNLGPVCPAQVEVPYAKTLLLHADCPTPGRDSNDLEIWGEMYDQLEKSYAKAVSVIFKLPDASEKTLTVTGSFEGLEFKNAKAYIDKDIEASWENLKKTGAATLTISSGMFARCVSPTATPVPTETPPPGWGAPAPPNLTEKDMKEVPHPRRNEHSPIAGISFALAGATCIGGILYRRKRQK